MRICRRAYRLLTGRAGFAPEDIIFDPNIFAVATGMEEHNGYGVAFIEATREIKRTLPHALVSGGVSNISFGFRGNNPVREAIHAVFLYHAIGAGMDLGIVNAGQLALYEEIPADLRERVEDVVLARRADATERLLEIASEFKGTGAAKVVDTAWRDQPVEARLDPQPAIRNPQSGGWWPEWRCGCGPCCRSRCSTVWRGAGRAIFCGSNFCSTSSSQPLLGRRWCWAPISTRSGV